MELDRSGMCGNSVYHWISERLSYFTSINIRTYILQIKKFIFVNFSKSQ